MTYIDENDKLFKYVEPLNDENKHLECPVCHYPLEDPITEPNCRNMICKQCFENRLKDNNNKCPICLTECVIDKTTIPLFITKQLDNLKVHCKVCNDANEIRRVDFPNHLENFCKTPCERGCGEFLTKSQVESHNKICKKYPVECSAKDIMCHWRGIREEKENHELKCVFISLEPVLSFLLKKIDILENNQNTHKEKCDSIFKTLK